MNRPLPPPRLCEYGSEFEPAPEIEKWLRKTFIEKKGVLYNKEHDHLGFASVGCLWTNAPNVKRGFEIAGTAEMPFFRGDAWQKARQQYQLEQWFGFEPRFLITLSAPIAARAPDAHWLAVAEHELLHCGQARDGYGNLKWTKAGPKFALRSHDFEQFYLILERYGPEAAGMSKVVEILAREPVISAEQVRFACGSCNATF
ncbi:MAG TPA: putative metallopeptidase [Blastocatellia bacterium]